jgi:hypothetical protein
MSLKTDEQLLPRRGFADAKAHLSELMTNAVHRHQMFLLDRHHGREQALVVSADDLVALLEPCAFAPKVSVSDGEFVVRLPELNLIAAAAQYDEAISELVELSEQYAENFLGRLDFYMQTDRRTQLPWVLRIALTDPEGRAPLIFPEVHEEPHEVAQLA